MHLLYLDDSGAVGNADESHIFLAGVSVFERQSELLSKKLDTIASRIRPDDPHHLEFRGSMMFGGGGPWRKVPKAERRTSYLQALGLLALHDIRVFGAAIHKAAISPHDPMEFAFEQLCNRFDRFLGRLHHDGDTQRGLVILDKSSYETSLQSLAREFRANGHRWGMLYNFADVPLFVDSRATRMIQYADMIAYALRRHYENGTSEYFDVIAHKFDAVGGVVHGLVHYKPQNMQCNCLHCRQR